MNYREIIGPDELDWKVIPLDWKKIGKEELKMGTPMSKDGVEANDASCYGILMDDVQKDKHFQARVIVSGCVDFAKAEEYSGIKISAEAKKAIGKVWSQGGGGLTELPEGYPYKGESRVTVDVSVTGIPGSVMCKVSDEVPELIPAGTKIHTWSPGYTDPDTVEVIASVADGFSTQFSSVSVALKDNAIVPHSGHDILLPEKGVYFFAVPGMTYNSGVAWDSTATEPVIAWDGQIGLLQRMAEEFMPLLTSPNGTKYKLTVSDDGTLSAVAQS